jgi:hypothetical protein
MIVRVENYGTGAHCIVLAEDLVDHLGGIYAVDGASVVIPLGFS